MSQNYFIAIGIGQYTNGPQSLGESCKNDCRHVVNALTDYGFTSLKTLLDEDATLANIRSLFDNLRDDPAFNKKSADPPNNLVIYYSGHGVSLELFGAKKYFYWVPSDYPLMLEEDPDDRYLYSWENQLMQSLGNIRFQHLILINDSCFSGVGLTVHNLVSQTKQLIGFNPKEERSVWAICSCAANQLSYAGETSSLFTARLVDRLKNHELDEFNVSTLVDDLNNIKDLPNQRVFGERLHVIGDNIGNYRFKLGRKAKEVKALRAVAADLKLKLPRYLNYKNEREALKALKKDEDAIVIFSNHKDSALPLMMRSARTEPRFRAHEKDLKIIYEKAINHELDTLQKCFSFFNLTMRLKGPVDTKEDLIKKIAVRLEAKDYFIGILLNEESRKNKNLEFVTELINIVNATHDLREFKGHLCLFILDEFSTDYGALNLKNGNKIASKLIMEKIAINSGDIDYWYDEHLKSITNEIRRGDFIKSFLTDDIYCQICNTFVEETPAFVIRQICEKAKCPELAEFLLTQIED
jgi:hypothetical protein